MKPNIPTNGTLSFMMGNFTLRNKEIWTSQRLNISFPELGENQIVIVELWQIKRTQEFFYNKVWLRLNITI